MIRLYRHHLSRNELLFKICNLYCFIYYVQSRLGDSVSEILSLNFVIKFLKRRTCDSKQQKLLLMLIFLKGICHEYS